MMASCSAGDRLGHWAGTQDVAERGAVLKPNPSYTVAWLWEADCWEAHTMH